MKEDRQGDVLVIRPVGKLDSNTSDEFQTRLVSRLDAGLARLVVDMSGTDYVSSAGLQVFLLAAKKLRARNGQLALAALNPGVRQVFELAGFLAIFTVEPDVARALARVS